MKIGVFDSGVGGLVVLKGLRETLSRHDYVYLGDTAHVPYGNRSKEAVYELTKDGVNFLFQQGCELVIIACNTASADALRKLQQEYLPVHYPERRILGVLIPAAEEAARRTQTGCIGVLATSGTVTSGAFLREIIKRKPNATITQVAAPLLVPLIENNALRHAPPILNEYLEPLRSAHIDTLVLGCTHYPLLAPLLSDLLPDVHFVRQDECVPLALENYLQRHSLVASKTPGVTLFVTDISPSVIENVQQILGVAEPLIRVSYDSL